MSESLSRKLNSHFLKMLQNRANFFLKLLKNRLAGGRTPLVAVINIIARCNLRCGYCYGQYFQSKTKDFTTQELLGLIDDLGKMGTRSLTLAGGEPLLRADIGEVIKRVKNNGMECGMNTNGTLIPQRLKELETIDMITVSIDGPKKMNDANRGQGSFEKIMAGIEAALKAGIKTHINALITRHNCQIETIDWLVELARKKGMQAEFNFLFHQAEDKDDSDRFMPENSALRRVIKRIVKHKTQRAPILFSKKAYQVAAEWPDYQKRLFMDKEPDFDSIPCYAGRFMLFIDADGKVYPCMQLIDDFKALDFRQAGIKKAWDNCAHHTCKACYFPCFNEFNLITGLDPRVIWAQILNTVRGR